jgi:hypothetical protein
VWHNNEVTDLTVLTAVNLLPKNKQRSNYKNIGQHTENRQEQSI